MELYEIDEVSLLCQNQSLEREFWKFGSLTFEYLVLEEDGQGLKCDIWRLETMPLRSAAHPSHVALRRRRHQLLQPRPSSLTNVLVMAWWPSWAKKLKLQSTYSHNFSIDLTCHICKICHLFNSLGSNEELWVFPVENHPLHSPSDLLELTLPCSSSRQTIPKKS